MAKSELSIKVQSEGCENARRVLDILADLCT